MYIPEYNKKIANALQQLTNGGINNNLDPLSNPFNYQNTSSQRYPSNFQDLPLNPIQNKPQIVIIQNSKETKAYEESKKDKQLKKRLKLMRKCYLEDQIAKRQQQDNNSQFMMNFIFNQQ